MPLPRNHAGYAEDYRLRPFDTIDYNRFRPCGQERPLNIGTKNLEQSSPNSRSTAPVYWRVEGSLADLTTVRPVAFFTWNAQTFLERWVRRGMVLVMAVLRPFLYAANRTFATRVVHTVLRGISRDRLDLLGEEYFKYKLQPYLKADGMELLKSRIESGDDIVLVSQGLEHVMRPLAQHLGVKRLIANRLEFRDGIATGGCSSRLFAHGDFSPESMAPDPMAGAPQSDWFAIWGSPAFRPCRVPWFLRPVRFPLRIGPSFTSMAPAIPSRSRFARLLPGSTSC